MIVNDTGQRAGPTTNHKQQHNNQQTYIIHKYSSRLRPTLISKYISLYPRSILKRYYRLPNTSITNINQLYLWYVEND